MFNLTGRLINVFTQQGGTNKKGETFEDRDKIQVLGGLNLENGDIKHELVTLSVQDGKEYSSFLNEQISLSVGYMAVGRNVVFYVPKGTKPSILNASTAQKMTSA